MRRLSQLQFAAGTNNTRPLISMVEHGRANLSVARLAAAAKTLGVSLDFLCGLTTDPTPAGQFARELADSVTRARDLEALKEHRDRRGRRLRRRLGACRRGGRRRRRRRARADHRPRQVPADVACPPRPDRPALPRHPGPRRIHGADPGRWVLHPGESNRPATESRSHLRRPYRRRPGRQARRQGPGRRLAARQRQRDKETWPTVPWPADAPVIGEVEWAARTFA